jgi:hypothetical protein
MELAGQIPASTLFQCWRVWIVFFAHRVTGLPGCWVAVMFNHPSAWVADRDRPAATSVLDRAANVCHLADAASVAWPTQPGMNLAAT